MITAVMFVIGVILLVVGADRLVAGASGLARRIGVSSVVIGLTVVALGTSTPELFVSCVSAVQGRSDISVGNVVGSNISNLLLILGVTALIMPMTVSSRLLRFDAKIMLATAAGVSAMSLDGIVSRFEGIALLISLGCYLVLSVKMSGKISAEQDTTKPLNSALSIIWIVLGLVSLVIGSQLVLTSSVTMAKALGLSELVIGLTIVAVGTSLPEIATSLMASKRGDVDMSVGNLVGSNILNILAILGLSSVIAPEGLVVSDTLRLFDIPVMLVVSVAVIPLFWTHGMVTRLDSLALVAGYLLYVASLLLDWNDPLQFRVLAIAAGGYASFSAMVMYKGVRVTIKNLAKPV